MSNRGANDRGLSLPFPKVRCSLAGEQLMVTIWQQHPQYGSQMILRTQVMLPHIQSIFSSALLFIYSSIYLFIYQPTPQPQQHGIRALWCRSQTRLRSGFAVAVVQAGSYSSNSTLSLGTSICYGCSPEKKERKKIFKMCVKHLA